MEAGAVSNSDNKPIRISRIRRQLLQRHQLAPMPVTKQLVDPATIPSPLRKTPTMRMLEYKYHIELEDFISHGSLNDIASKLKSDNIDRATISRWRKQFKEQRKAIAEAKFFNQFNDVT
jgi:hypothetical protein